MRYLTRPTGGYSFSAGGLFGARCSRPREWRAQQSPIRGAVVCGLAALSLVTASCSTFNPVASGPAASSGPSATGGPIGLPTAADEEPDMADAVNALVALLRHGMGRKTVQHAAGAEL